MGDVEACESAWPESRHYQLPHHAAEGTALAGAGRGAAARPTEAAGPRVPGTEL